SAADAGDGFRHVPFVRLMFVPIFVSRRSRHGSTADALRIDRSVAVPRMGRRSAQTDRNAHQNDGGTASGPDPGDALSIAAGTARNESRQSDSCLFGFVHGTELSVSQ